MTYQRLPMLLFIVLLATNINAMDKVKKYCKDCTHSIANVATTLYSKIYDNFTCCETTSEEDQYKHNIESYLQKAHPNGEIDIEYSLFPGNIKYKVTVNKVALERTYFQFLHVYATPEYINVVGKMTFGKFHELKSKYGLRKFQEEYHQPIWIETDQVIEEGANTTTRNIEADGRVEISVDGTSVRYNNQLRVQTDTAGSVTINEPNYKQLQLIYIFNYDAKKTNKKNN